MGNKIKQLIDINEMKPSSDEWENMETVPHNDTIGRLATEICSSSSHFGIDFMFVSIRKSQQLQNV